MKITTSEIEFEDSFYTLFPNTKISCFRYGNEEQVYHVHYFLPLYNKHLKGSDYFYDEIKNYSHFTSIESIKGIITSRSIRLYNLNNLKDPREYTYAGGILNKDPKRLKDSLDNLFNLSLIKLDKNEKGFMSKKFNMWRLYGKDGKGCLINFEFSITPPLDWHEFYFAPIKYGIEKKINISRLKRYLDNINRSSEKIGIDLDPLPCFHKSGLYRMEKEFRLLYDGREIKGYKPRNITQNGIKIFPNIFVEPRNRSTKLIKYLDLPIFKSAFQNIDESIPILKINSITLGYQFKNNFDRKRSELESLANQNLGYVPEITRSLLSKTYWGK